MAVVGKNAESIGKLMASKANQLQQDIKQGVFGQHAPEVAGQVASMEGLDVIASGNITASLESIAVQLGSSMQGLFGPKGPAQTQLNAAAVIAMAAANPSAYHAAALRAPNMVASHESMHVVGIESPAEFDYVEKMAPAMEAFENSNLTDFIGLSMMYNLKTARQDAFGEGFYRTVVLTPDNGGADVSIRSQLVLNHFLHNTKGDYQDFKQKRLLEAAINYKILADESTTLVPEIHSGNKDLFVSESVVPSRTIDLGNRTVTTSPLLFGKRVNLIGLGQNTLVKIAGQADNTDSLDRTTALKSVYLQKGDGDVLRIDTENMPRAAFFKPPQGLAREQELNFRNSSIQINSKSLDHLGLPFTDPILRQIVDGDYVVTLNMTITGDVNVEKGNAEVQAMPITIAGIVNAAGENLDLTASPAKELVAQLADLVPLGWEPAARLSNANRRLRGLQLNSSEYTERYPVMLGAPFSMPSPLAEQRDASDIDLLVTAARLRNSNNAVTQLIRYTENLARWKFLADEMPANDLLPEVEGIARFLVRPWFRETVLDLRKVVVSLKSHERVLDIQAALVNVLRNDVYDAIIESNYQTALDAYTGYSGESIHVRIGTDPKINRFIVVPGDSRTLGDGVEFDKVTTMDARVRGEIYWTFVRATEGLDPLNSGSMLWIPELISHVNVARNDAQIREAMVQPRSRHVNHLPIWGKVKVEGLAEVLSEGWKIPVGTFSGNTDTPITSPVVPGTPGADAGDTGTGTQP